MSWIYSKEYSTIVFLISHEIQNHLLIRQTKNKSHINLCRYRFRFNIFRCANIDIINKEDSPAALLINHEIKNHLLIRQTGLDKGGVQNVTYKFRLIEIIFHFCCLVRL